MAHTTFIDEYAFIHNGDYSGDTRIVSRSSLEGPPPEEIKIPVEVLEKFLAEKLRKEFIAAIENLDLDQPGARKALAAAARNTDTWFRIAGR